MWAAVETIYVSKNVIWVTVRHALFAEDVKG
ncbi:hypothetical protein T11_5896 [Trichinella zimbabwensis]|uniref:Uncharacterized protein n=1 Tax=Trichinella zimbabwensis TaxID=268475 RepID=A0A0V1GG70_9BILA|nr:hypothetical protein T11_5896 [Trichinella zimbabwensis]